MARERFTMPGEGEPGPGHPPEAPRGGEGSTGPNPERPLNPGEAIDPNNVIRRIINTSIPGISDETATRMAEEIPPEQRPRVMSDFLDNIFDRMGRGGAGMGLGEVADLQRIKEGGVPMSPEERARMLRDAERASMDYGDPLYNQLRRAKDRGDFVEVEEIIDGRLRAIEEDEQDVAGQQQNVQTLQHIIDSLFRDMSLWRAELASLLHARLQLHLGNFCSRYIGGEALAGIITNFQEFHWMKIVNTAGVRRMIEFMEEPDENGAKGAYYRKVEVKEDSEAYRKLSRFFKKPLDSKDKMWLVDKQLQLLREQADPQIRPEDKPGLRHMGNYTADSTLLQYALTKLEDTQESTRKTINAELAIQEIIKELESDKATLATKLSARDLEKVESFVERDSDRPSSFKRDTGGNYIINVEGIKFDKLLYELHRAHRLALRTEITLTMANSFDGAHWKRGVNMPKKFITDGIEVEIMGQGANRSEASFVQLNPKLVYDFRPWKDQYNLDPRILAFNNGVVEIDLARDPHLLNLTEAEKIARYGDPADPDRITQAQRDQKEVDDVKTVALLWLRTNKMHLIGITWEKAWRGFYKEYWDDLDFSKAQSGISARESRKTTHFPLTLEKPGEDKPGIVKELRRFAHTGALSLDQLFAYESALNAIDKWGANFPKVKGYAARLRGGDQLRAMLTGGKEPDLLNNPNSIANFAAALIPIKAQLKTYMSDSPEDEQEVNSIMSDWVKALAKFNKHRIHKVFPQYKNADALTLDSAIYAARAGGLIDDETAKKLASEVIAPTLIRFFLVNAKLVSVPGAFMGMLGALIKYILAKQ